MKRLFLLIALAGAAAMVSCSSASKAVKSETDAANAQVVASMLDSRVYKMDFNRAYPSSGPSFALTYPYYVSVIRDRVESFLPYFGRTYSLPYGGGEGLRFDAPMLDYEAVQGKKGQQVVTFKARTEEDTYQFRIEIYPTGGTYLSINALNKQSMSFNGQVDLDAEFELIRITD